MLDQNEALIRQRALQIMPGSCAWFHQSGYVETRDDGTCVNLLTEHIYRVCLDSDDDDEVLLPVVGEVWVRAHKHVRGEGVDLEVMNHSRKKHQDIITVQRVGKDSVIGWDGSSPDIAKVKHCDLEEFNPKALHGWRHAAALSAIVDKVFFEDPSRRHNAFKVMCVCQREVPGFGAPGAKKTEIVIRDHEMEIRPLPSPAANGLTEKTFHSLCETVLEARMREQEAENAEDEMSPEAFGEMLNAMVNPPPKETVGGGAKDEGGAVRGPSLTDGDDKVVAGTVSSEEGDAEGESIFSAASQRTNEEAPEDEMVGWATVSYEKYGRPSARSPRPNRNRYARLWANRLDTRRTYRHKPISMDALATLRSHDGAPGTGTSRRQRIVSNKSNRKGRR